MPMRHARALASEHRVAAPASDREAAPDAREPESRRIEHGGIEGLYRSEAPRLHRFFRRRIHDANEAPDLVHEAFVRLAAFMSRDGLANPAPYLQRIARNLLFERSRQRTRRRAASHVPLEEGRDVVVAPAQEQDLAHADLMRLYQAAVDDLPEKTRAVFLLHRIDDLTYREIGERLDISIPTVQYHVARALARISTALESE